MYMIRASGAALTAGSDVSFVSVFARICVSGLCRHLLCSGTCRHLLCIGMGLQHLVLVHTGILIRHSWFSTAGRALGSPGR